MIVIEHFINSIDGKTLKKTYSDRNKKIKKIGTDEIYDEAIDLLDSPFVYEETEEDIVVEETPIE